MNSDEYQCHVCRGVFTKGWSDEEAAVERQELWPGIPLAECELVCDDCHKKFMVWYKSESA